MCIRDRHGVGVDGQLVAALLEGDAVDLLVLHGVRLVGRVDGHLSLIHI